MKFATMFFILLVSLLVSGCLNSPTQSSSVSIFPDPTTNILIITPITTAHLNEQQSVSNILAKTDRNIARYIKSITIYDAPTVPCIGDDDAIGCEYASTINGEIKPISAVISIISSKYWKYKLIPWKYNFEGTLQHEIGHVKGDMVHNGTEEFAGIYARQKLMGRLQ